MIRITHKELLAEGFEMKPERYEKKRPENKYDSFKIKEFEKKLREGLFILVTFTYSMKDNWTLKSVNASFMDGNEQIPILANSKNEILKVLEHYQKTSKPNLYKNFTS